MDRFIDSSNLFTPIFLHNTESDVHRRERLQKETTLKDPTFTEGITP